MDLPLILDGLMIFLLIVTIVYAAILSRRLAFLRSNREEFETFIQRFNEASRRAEESIRGLRATAEHCQATVAEPFSRAEAMRDELLFLIERADGAAEKLSRQPTTAGGGNSAGKTPSAPQGKAARTEAPARGRGGGDAEVGSAAERRLLNALRKSE